jgi:3-oxoacyl-(acyl-carrier-protein) synthase/thioesterase domain-containing protein/acyl carrier protein
MAERLDTADPAAQPDTALAIVGMAGRFPGAADIDALWRLLLRGEEAVREFSRDELRAAGVPDAVAEHPAYVPFGTQVADADAFDAQFFGFTPAEARITDPQQRVFLECAWSALEDAGTPPSSHEGRIGVFGSTTLSSYLYDHVLPSGEALFSYPVLIGNDKDYLCTRVSYRLNLAGPSVTVQTACSSSLVALHLAAQSLLERECDVAVVGGVSILARQTIGYLYQEGGTLSRDGHCRVFDADASGMVKGNGCGIVVVKRYADALADRDRIYAVVRGTAVNNDGATKMGYTAPSAAGQAAVIREALAFAGVPATDIGYVETHGTGTRLGDPIEVRALAEAHRADGDPPAACALGSLKANLGHLDAAAGVAGLIKAALVLRHQTIPPQINLRTLNPELKLDGTGYRVPLVAAACDPPLRAAAVSSFGIGGTNAHCVLVPDPAAAAVRPAPPAGQYPVVLSARDDEGLRSVSRDLLERLDREPALRLDDLAFTLLAGRTPMPRRLAFAARGIAEVRGVLRRYLDGGPAPDDRRAPRWLTDPPASLTGRLRYARTTALPTYPFRRERHWIAPPAATAPPAGAEAAPVRGSGAAGALATRAAGALATRAAGVLAGGAAAAGAEPPADIDAEVLAIIRDRLAIPEAGPDDDYLDLGGDSVTAVDIVSAIRDRCGVALSVADFEDLGTARRIGTRVRMSASLAVPDTVLTRIKDGAADRAVFLVHPAGGTTFCYREFARHSTDPGGMYALAFPLAEADRLQSIPDLADRYLKEIRAVRPTGPYRLGGYSFGGNVAHEMAVRLQAAGAEVERLVLFDAHPPAAYAGDAVGETEFLDAFPLLLESVFGIDPAVFGGRRPASLDEAVAVARQPTWSDAVAAEYRRFFTVWRHNHDALKAYRPSARFHGHVVVLAASEPEDQRILDTLRIRPLPRQEWRHHVSGTVTVVPVPGNHYTMLSEKAHARALARYYDEAVRD